MTMRWIPIGEADKTKHFVSRDGPENGTRDHLPRVLRDYLNEENGRAHKLGFDDGYAEGYAKAAALRAAQTKETGK